MPKVAFTDMSVRALTYGPRHDKSSLLQSRPTGSALKLTNVRCYTNSGQNHAMRRLSAKCQKRQKRTPLLNPALIAPSEHVKLRQNRRIEPPVFNCSFGKPTQTAHQVAKIRPI